MGKSAAGGKLEVTEYRLSAHVGVALRLDSVRRVIVDDKEAFRGNVTSNTTLTINKPDLFGGEKKEGGLVGAIEVMLGGDTQLSSSQLATRYGLTPSTAPGFRGFTSLFFRGSGQTASGYFNAWNIIDGEWPGNVGGNGFLWRHNQPFIAQKIEVEGTCAPRTTLNQTYALIPNPDHADRPDANPAHMLWEAYVDDEFGMGTDPSGLDADAFEAAAETLFDEGFGLSMLWTEQTEIEKIVDEILQHIQGTVFTDPDTGKITLKLHRFDYDVETLPVISPDNATLSNWQVRSPGEIVNTLTVSWTNPENEQEESITGHVLAAIDSQDGQAVAGSRNYYAVRHAGLARTLLARDLRESTAHLASCEAVLDRTFWNVKPGDVVKVSWPRRSAYERIMRVGKVNYGKPGASTIRVSLVEDVFALELPPIAIDPGTGWVDPSADPSPLTMQLTTLPSFFTRNGSLQKGVVAIERPEVLVMSLADSQDEDSLDYELVGEAVDPSGVTRILSRGSMSMTPLSELTATMNAAATSELPATLFTDINWGPQIGGFVWFGYGDTNQEVALVTGRTETGWTLERGALDTIPRTWAAGTPVWCVNPGARIVDELTPQAGGATVAYRGLDRTSKGLLAYEDASDETATLTERPWLPLRPANVAVNGTAFGSLNVSGTSTIEITWATRNRLLEDTQPLAWTDGSVSPEYRQETIVRFYDVATGDLVAEYPYLWLDTSISFAKTAFDRWASVRVEVTSRRDDLEALQAHTVTLTGLANNPAAPLPPAPAARTTPPQVFPAPAVDAFVAVAGSDEGPDGSSVPTIVVNGTQDDLDADHLVIRYKKTGTTVWRDHPSVPLNGEAVSVEITGVQPTTQYDIEVGYLFDGQPSVYRTLSDVTTGSIVSGETVPVVPGNISGTPTLAIASSLGSDGTVRVLAAGDWNDATNAIAYVVELDDGVAVRTLEFAESKFSEIATIVGRTYRYRAKGKSRTGHLSASWSSWSASVAAGGDTTGPGPITSPTLTPFARRIVAGWVNPTDADYDGLDIARHTATTASPQNYIIARKVRGTVFPDTTVAAGVPYHYYARTVDRSGNPGSTWVYLGVQTATFVRVSGGDIDPTDQTLVTALDPNLITVTTGDGVALPMYLSGSDTATFVGGKYTRTAGTSNFNQMGISRLAIGGPAQVSGMLLHSQTGFGFTALSALSSNAQTSSLAHWYTTGADWRIYSGTALLQNCGTAFNGVTFSTNTVFSITDDGINQAWWADGVLMYSRPTPSGSLVRRAACYAYSTNKSVGSLKLEPFNNAQWSAVSGTGRPDDNASRADNLFVNATFERGLENYKRVPTANWALNGRKIRHTGTSGADALYLNTQQTDSDTSLNPMWMKLPDGGKAFLSYDKVTNGARRSRLIATFFSEAGVQHGTTQSVADDSSNTSGTTLRVRGSIIAPIGYPIARVVLSVSSPLDGTYGDYTNFRSAYTEELADVTGDNIAFGIDGQGILATEDAVEWDGPLILSRPDWATDGRVDLGLDNVGRLRRREAVFYDPENPELPPTVREIVGFEDLDDPTTPVIIGVDVPQVSGSVPESLQTYLARLPIFPEQFGAVGDGVTDDTAAIQAALDTGKDVWLSDKTYRTYTGLVMSTNQQRFMGPGEIDAYGSFNILTITNCYGAEISLNIHSPFHTGGFAVSVQSADRVKIARLYARNVYGVLEVYHNNLCSVEWLYASCRGAPMKWHGDATHRSDLLVLKEVWIGIFKNTGDKVHALEIDGNVHTLETTIFASVNAYGGDESGKGGGIIYKNTTGGPPPTIARIKHLELDFVYGPGIEWTPEAPCHDVDIVAAYIHNPHGPTGGSCILVNGMDRSGDLRITSGYFGSFKRYAIENNTVHAVHVDTALTIYNDAGGIGKFYGNVRGTIPRLDFDDNFVIYTDSGNCLIGYDANDFSLYSRSGNFWQWVIGGTERARISDEGVLAAKLGVDTNFYSIVSGGNPTINLDGSDYLFYDRGNNIWSVVIGGVARLQTSADGALSSKFAVDSTFSMTLSGGNPVLNLDANDYLSFARSTNTLSLVIGSTAVLNASAAELSHATKMKAPRFDWDTNFAAYLSSSNPIVLFDANDYMTYDRAGNTWSIVIGGSPRISVSAAGTVAAALFSGSGASLTNLNAGNLSSGTVPVARLTGTYDISISGSAAQLGGKTAASAATADTLALRDASGYLLATRFVVDTNFYNGITASNPTTVYDVNDYFSFNRAGNYAEFVIGGVQRWSVDGDGLKSTGFRVDDNMRFRLNGSDPEILFDTGDHLRFIRASNRLDLTINGATPVKFEQTKTTFESVAKLAPRAVSALPTGELGMIACVNDATSPTVGATVAGSGAASALVFHNGTDWKVIAI